MKALKQFSAFLAILVSWSLDFGGASPRHGLSVMIGPDSSLVAS